jgi:hypothetical protein
MAHDNDNEDGPIGPKFRKLREDVFSMDETVRRKSQLERLDSILEGVLMSFQLDWEQGLKSVFNAASAKKDPTERNKIAFEKLLGPASAKEEAVKTTLALKLPIDESYLLDTTAEDIRNLDSLRKIHQRASAHDYAVKVVGLTAEENAGGHGQALIIFDALKSYEEGREENAEFYPDLGEYTPMLKPKPATVIGTPAKRTRLGPG